MSHFESFINCDDFTEFELINQNQFTKIVTSQKYFSPSQKYVFKIFQFDCHSSKEQKVILDTFIQISKKKSQYLQSYKYLSFYFKSKLQPAFSMKYNPSKTLEQVLRTPNFLTEFKIENIIKCLFAVAEGMSYLHSNLILHGNLCPSNIIIDEANQFYLCDFGLYPIKELYVENEYLFNKDYKDPYMNNNNPSFSSDIYSFGVLMCDICIEILKESNKMKQNETLENFLKNKDENKFDVFPSFCAKLISSCMNSFTCERPNFNQIIKMFKQENQQIFRIEIKQLYKEFINSNYLLNLAAINDINALYKVGKMYEKGKIFEKDITKAIEFYEKASDLNNSDAQNNLGVLLQEEGRNKSDLIKGAKYLRLSAEKGNIYGMSNYGIALLNGDGVEKNILKAQQYLQKSADLGYSYAQLYYGNFLLDNVPTIPAINEGLSYIKKAMNQNNPNAFYVFGTLLQEGKFIEKNDDLAFETYKIAAEMGNKEAMVKYADENLKSPHKNEKIALKYYQIAFENGVTSVKSKIDKLKGESSREDSEDSLKQPNKINENSKGTLQKKNKQFSSNQNIGSLNKKKKMSVTSISDFTLIHDRHKKHVINADISQIEDESPSNDDSSPYRSSKYKSTNSKVSILDEKEYNDIKQKLKNNIPVNLPRKITLISLGEIVYDRENYHTRGYIYPVGYQIEKEYFSKLDPSKITRWRFTILDGGNSPIFQIECLDESKKIYKDKSLETVFDQIGIFNHTKDKHLSHIYFCGFKSRIITYLIERLPNANRCVNYEFRTFFPKKLSNLYDLNKDGNNNEENNNKNKVDEEEENDSEVEINEKLMKSKKSLTITKDDDDVDVDLEQPLEKIIKQGDSFFEKNNFIKALKCYDEAVNRGRKDLLIKCADLCQSFEKKLEYLEESVKEKIPNSFTKWRLTIMRRVYLTKSNENFHNFARLFESHQDFSDAAILYNKNKEILNSQICYEKAKAKIESIQDGYQQYDFALFLINKKDFELAKIMLEKAVQNKIPKAESKLEKLSQTNQPKTLNEVQSLLQKGIDYYEGTNEIKKDPIKAMEYFEQASELGCIKADFYIGKYNENEIGVKHLLKSVESGDPDAQNHYAHYLQRGIMMPKDKEKAMHYYKLAADQGQSEAAFEFGKEKYENGLSQEEKDEGIKYLKKSAESLFPDAIYIYSKICKDSNPEDSKKFFEFSIEKGSQLALLKQEINDE